MAGMEPGSEPGADEPYLAELRAKLKRAARPARRIHFQKHRRGADLRRQGGVIAQSGAELLHLGAYAGAEGEDYERGNCRLGVYRHGLRG